MLQNFCAMPWHHVCVKTNGDYAVCCQHKQPPDKKFNINTHSVDEWVDSDYLTSVKQSFLEDKRHPGCEVCWNAENQNLPSYRQRTKQEYEILGVDLQKSAINIVEIDLGNTCNLKCLMCGPTSSSSILKEWKMLNEPNVPEQKDFIWKDQAFDNLENLLAQSPKIVNVRGGEPMYEKRLLTVLQNINPNSVKNTVLHITTNATTWNNQWADVLSKFKMTRFMFSVDAVEDIYEYIRYPGNWKQVENNIKMIQQMPNTKCLVHAVVMNLNILNLDKLVDWCRAQSLYLDLDKLVYPEYLQVDNLPAEIKFRAINVCQSIERNTDNSNHIRQFAQGLIAVLESQKDQIANSRWEDFLNYIRPRDRLRNNSFTTVLD